ncbi:hypothetical protein GUJ93_ZPchr0006g45592 [Zizania palustris]|uniref:Uncharacterized protein n=1 Tax=Zizania palustris TaxID=103762 RepID=A0A8J5W4U0_ZIZPA|nr:hypothetical protein GUJ93_ZPchr0006g45592 [Zizania palustris]
MVFVHAREPSRTPLHQKKNRHAEAAAPSIPATECPAVWRPPLRRFSPLSAHRGDTVEPNAPTTRTTLHRALSPPNHAVGQQEQEAAQVCMEVPSDDPSNNNEHNNNEQEATQVCIINV